FEHCSGAANQLPDWLSRNPSGEANENLDATWSNLKEVEENQPAWIRLMQTAKPTYLEKYLSITDPNKKPSVEELIAAQGEDEYIREIRDGLEQDKDLSEFAFEFQIHDGLVYICKPKWVKFKGDELLPEWQELKLCIPQSMVERVIKDYHNTLAPN